MTNFYTFESSPIKSIYFSWGSKPSTVFLYLLLLVVFISLFIFSMIILLRILRVVEQKLGKIEKTPPLRQKSIDILKLVCWVFGKSNILPDRSTNFVKKIALWFPIWSEKLLIYICLSLKWNLCADIAKLPQVWLYRLLWKNALQHRRNQVRICLIFEILLQFWSQLFCDRLMCMIFLLMKLINQVTPHFALCGHWNQTIVHARFQTIVSLTNN